MPQNLAFIFLIVIGILFIVIAFLQKSKARKAAQTWPKVDGIVEKSELAVMHNTDEDGTSTSYAAKVIYSYMINELRYQNDAIGFGRASGGKKKALRKMEQYPEGSSVTVLYDPKDPTKAVLEPVATSFVTFIVVGIIMIISGIITFSLIS